MSAKAGYTGRVPELDGVRGLAILLVLTWHYVACNLAPAPPGSPWRLPDAALRLTWAGVDLFFVLSGFLIGGILLDNRGSPAYFRTFYGRRLLRIVPLYYAILGSYLLLGRAGAAYRFPWLLDGPGPPIWQYPAFLQNIGMAGRDTFGPHWLGVTWSLAVEEQFYLALPPIVRLCSRRTLAALAMAAVVLAPVARRAAFFRVSRHIGPYVLLPCRMDALALGVLIALAVRSPSAWGLVAARRRVAPVGACALAAALLGMAIAGWRPNFLYSVAAMLFATLIVHALVNPAGVAGRFFRSRPLRASGTLCYGLYLLHQPIQGVAFGLLRGKAPHVDGWADAAIAVGSLAASFILAELSWLYFEGPLVRLGKSLRYGDASG